MLEVRETVIEHCEGDKYAAITAAEPSMVNRLKKLSRNLSRNRAEISAQFEAIAENEDGSLFVHVPWSWVRIAPPKQVNMTDEQRKAASERMKALKDRQKQDLSSTQNE